MALITYAMDEAKSRGRRYPEPPHPYRNSYARDRDRVIHSRAFRRLEAKTQVFTMRCSDHFRNRLTHTLEVAQIARTVAGALGLDTDLAEALALVHDIGHPPFGHAGERKLDELMRPHGGRFDHNLHALRIVEEIAYNTADLDDGYEAKLLDIEMIRSEVPVFAELYGEVERSHPQGLEKLKFNEAVKSILDRLATDLIENTRAEAAASGANSVEDVRHLSRRLAGFSPRAATENAALKKFLLERLYNQPAIVMDRERSVEALGQLFEFYLDHVEAMPKSYAELAQHGARHRVVCDYIAGMTDHFLLRQHQDLLGASSHRSSAKRGFISTPGGKR